MPAEFGGGGKPAPVGCDGAGPGVDEPEGAGDAVYCTGDRIFCHLVLLKTDIIYIGTTTRAQDDVLTQPNKMKRQFDCIDRYSMNATNLISLIISITCNIEFQESIIV